MSFLGSRCLVEDREGMMAEIYDFVKDVNKIKVKIILVGAVMAGMLSSVERGALF